MNNVELIGRLTRDPAVRYTAGEDPQAVATFTLAIDRPTKEKQADYPRVIVFGKQAESCGKYLKQGRLTAVQGRIQTGSYKNKAGDTVYTTDVVASRVEFIDYGSQEEKPAQAPQERYTAPVKKPEEQISIPNNFEEIDEDVPF